MRYHYHAIIMHDIESYHYIYNIFQLRKYIYTEINNTILLKKKSLCYHSHRFINTSVEYLLGPSVPVTVIEYRDSIDHVLMVMEENNIISVPVVDLEKRRYVGMSQKSKEDLKKKKKINERE